MPFSLYHASVGAYLQILPSVAGLVAKAEAHCAEKGLPAVAAENWYGIVAPAATPPAIVAKLNETIVAALRSPQVREKLTPLGAILVGNTPDEFRAYILSEEAKWAEVVRVSGAKLE